MTILLIVVGVICGASLMYLIIKPQLLITAQENTQIQQHNKQLEEQNKHLDEQNKEKLKETERLNSIIADEEGKFNSIRSYNQELFSQKVSLLEQIELLKNNSKQMEDSAKEAAESFYSLSMANAQAGFDAAIERAALECQENIENFNIEYQTVVDQLLEKYKQLQAEFQELSATNQAAIDAAKRAEEMRSQKDFYRIQLSEQDVQEIAMLREIVPRLRSAEPLNKVIWKVYYEKPTTDLIGRVIGAGSRTGIYKITEIATGKCYVGQAADLASRWKQHIKRAVGAEPLTKNKLYPAMQATGAENFTFEVIEECDRNALDEREKFWQKYFEAQTFGFSIR